MNKCIGPIQYTSCSQRRNCTLTGTNRGNNLRTHIRVSPKPQAPQTGAPTIIRMKVRGGGPINPGSLAPKVGPLGIAPKVVGDRIVEATKDIKGIRCMVKITIANRQAEVKVIPTASMLVVKALNEPKMDRKKGEHRKHQGDLSMDDVTEIAKVIRGKSNARTMSGTVKEVLGTCISIGATCEGEDPREKIAAIDRGDIVVEDYEAPPFVDE